VITWVGEVIPSPYPTDSDGAAPRLAAQRRCDLGPAPARPDNRIGYRGPVRFPDAWPRDGLWRHADFLRLWAAQIVSAWGSRITRTALPIIAVDMLGQAPSGNGVLAALTIFPGIALALVIGGIIDRSNKRTLLLTADIVRGVLVLSLPIAWWLGHLGMVHLIVVGAGVGAMTTLFSITDNTYLPSLVGKPQLAEANAKLEGSEAVAEVGGPAAAGALIMALGAPLAVLVDALTYIWSAAFLWRIRDPGAPPATPSRRDVIGDLRVGLRAAFGHPVLRRIAFAQMAWYASAGAFIALYTPFVRTELELSVGWLGFIIAFGGVGGFLGALVARRLHNRHGLGPTLFMASAISLIASLLIPLAQAPLWLALGLLITHQVVSDGANVVVQVHSVTTQQTLLPQAILGRATAALHVCAIGMMPVGALVFGFVADAIGIRGALWIGLGIGAGSPLAFATLWRIRTLPIVEPTKETIP
jgi:MFS family permease